MKNNIIYICPSWEERTLLGFERSLSDLDPIKVVSIQKENPINGTEISRNIEKLQDLCKQRNITYKELLWSNSPAINNLNLDNYLKEEVLDGHNIHIDISTMPRDIIWTFLSLFKHYENHVNIRYYEPDSYNEIWLSKEPYSPRLLLRHSGIIVMGKPTCVIVITSFDVERTKQIVSKFEPQKVVLCVQKGNQFLNKTRNQKIKHEMVCRDVGVNDILSVEIDSFSKDFGKCVINEILDSLSDYNVILTSFGPKLSSIGAYMAYLNHPEIALCYVPCKEYNLDYSKGIGKLYTISFQ